MAIDLNDLRQRVLSDQPVTREELRAAIEALAPQRASVMELAAQKAPAAPSQGKISLDDLLNPPTA